jgi:hypothetical protein
LRKLQEAANALRFALRFIPGLAGAVAQSNAIPVEIKKLVLAAPDASALP